VDQQSPGISGLSFLEYGSFCKTRLSLNDIKNKTMRIIRMIKHLFIRQSKYASLFSAAITEGIKDAFKEMGYQLKKDSTKK